ncbi:hypothetical protein HanPI659440_Chr17g0682701 [Helianthus annuus]|nr:hypothetical protein HanPI659440_Chr17g0682701 [Helianthus annuus]
MAATGGGARWCTAVAPPFSFPLHISDQYQLVAVHLVVFSVSISGSQPSCFLKKKKKKLEGIQRETHEYIAIDV